MRAGALDNGDSAHLNEVEKRQRELQTKQQQLLREQRTADQEKLLSCITGECQPLPLASETTSMRTPPDLTIQMF